jgi:hypothetical protein
MISVPVLYATCGLAHVARQWPPLPPLRLGSLDHGHVEVPKRGCDQ